MQAHIVRLIYLVAIATAMFGWIWLILDGIEWLLAFDGG